jgi:hypothetical protein
MGEHSTECASADQNHHPAQSNVDDDAVEGGVAKQPKARILGGARYEHQEVHTEGSHHGTEDHCDEDVDASVGPAEEDANAHGHTYVAHDADPPGRSGHRGNERKEQGPDQKGRADRERPPQENFRDSVITSRGRRIRHYAAFLWDPLSSVPSLRHRTERSRITKAESRVHEPLGNTWSSSNMLETM